MATKTRKKPEVNVDAVREWLSLWDKHLWGTRATYAEAARLSGILNCTGTTIRSLVFNGDGDYRGTAVKFWKSPDLFARSKRKYKGERLLADHWNELVSFVVSEREEITKPDTTMAFVVRMARERGLKANRHAITEVLNLRHIPIPKDEPSVPVGKGTP